LRGIIFLSCAALPPIAVDGRNDRRRLPRLVRREHHFRLTAVAGRRNDRLNEITFNASVVLEANAIEAINSLLVELGGLGVVYTGRYKPVRLHAIRNDKLMEQLGFASKNSTSRGFLSERHGGGYQTAETCLGRHRTRLGSGYPPTSRWN
jgi:hypothetical protein